MTKSEIPESRTGINLFNGAPGGGATFLTFFLMLMLGYAWRQSETGTALEYVLFSLAICIVGAGYYHAAMIRKIAVRDAFLIKGGFFHKLFIGRIISASNAIFFALGTLIPFSYFIRYSTSTETLLILASLISCYAAYCFTSKALNKQVKQPYRLVVSAKVAALMTALTFFGIHAWLTWTMTPTPNWCSFPTLTQDIGAALQDLKPPTGPLGEAFAAMRVGEAFLWCFEVPSELSRPQAILIVVRSGLIFFTFAAVTASSITTAKISAVNFLKHQRERL